MNQNWFIGLLAAAVVVVGFVAFTGNDSQGVQGLQGPRGEQGMAGLQGETGSQGARGYAGSNGASGTAASPVFGGSSPENFEHNFFRVGLTEGGGVRATTTTAATETLTAVQMQRSKVFRFLGSATAAAITVTLPATSTMSSVLPNAGDTRTWIFENGYTAAATTTTIAAGTGIDLQEPDGQNVVIGIDNYAYITCHREVSTDIVCLVDESIPAD